MKKMIEITEESVARLVQGKCVQGSLRMDELTGRVSFRPYRRLSRTPGWSKNVHRLEHGWVKESKERIKLFESVPKRLGLLRVLHIIDRDTSEAKDAVMEWDMIESM